MSNSLDFSRLVSREYRPAGVAQLKPSDKHNLRKKSSHKKSVEFQHDVVGGGGGNDDDDDDDNKNNKNVNKGTKPLASSASSSSTTTPADVRHARILHDLTTDHVPTPTHMLSREEQEEEASRLVLQLVSKTPAYTRHLHHNEGDQQGGGINIVKDTELKHYIRLPQNNIINKAEDSEFSSSFHQVELGDWESKIQWGGYKPEEKEEDNNGITKTTSPNSADAFLQQRRNPFLEDMDFDQMISWTGDKEDMEQKAKALPLILELGVAGQSIARHVLPSHRPTPCVKSEEYQNRMQANWTGEIKSTAELSKGTLHADREQKERFIQQRQEKRRQMAKDKTNRVTEAMGTLSVLAGGRGRTITSSLMGPGGTERTGRPSRRIESATHDTTYVEQLDMVANHILFRDLSKVSLRQFHRPKLPWTIVRTSLLWQFAIRYSPSNKKGAAGTAGGVDSNSSSYQAMMMGTHPGAVSKAKLRSEADLTPTEGKLVLLEYAEERPPIQLTKGMASKIVTYYRGDKSRCPVSAGGGDRPTRRRRQGTEADIRKADNNNNSNNPSSNKSEKLHRLKGPNHAMDTTITDWVGKPPKKSKEDKKSEQPGIDVLPEGVTEILHPKVHGPFIGEIEDGQAVTGLVSNLFVAPIFQHEPESTDFLMILGRNSGASTPGRLERMSVILREMPPNVYTVGQTEPRTRVWAPNTVGEKNFTGPLVSYLAAKVLTRVENRDGHGLRLDEIQERVLPNVGIVSSKLRLLLKNVAEYDKNTQIWTTKKIGYEDYPGVDALGKAISVEGVTAYETANAAVTRLNDLGIYQLFSGAHACSSVGVAMVYLAGQVNAVRELGRKVKSVLKFSSDSLTGKQKRYYEDAVGELEALSKTLRRRHEVAKFIYEELQMAPWHLTGEFFDVHTKGEGTGMMKLTGLGDPSGIGEGFSFLRESDAKPTKSVGAAPVNQKDKITGTEDDLRKLTMKQMASILRSYGMAQKDIDTLKRWDRVHVIRDLSTKAASDGIGDGLERFARGEKLKLSDQKQMYRDRIQVIWKRQLAALSDSGDRAAAGDGAGGPSEVDDTTPAKTNEKEKKKLDDGGGDSDSEDEEDFAAAMEEEMMDRADANQLVADQVGESEGMRGESLRMAMQDQESGQEALELARLRRQAAEADKARAGLSAADGNDGPQTIKRDRPHRVVRRRITKTHPDGRQTTMFKFIIHASEVGEIMARLVHEKKERARPTERPTYPPDEKQVGHAMFEDEDDFEFSTRGRGMLKGRGKRRGRAATTAKGLRMKTSKKRRRGDDDDFEIYTTSTRRKGTSNRKERGSIRERRPHVILANKLEGIRSLIESRPTSGAFHKPVNRRALPRYYELISDPIDLSAIRDKIKKYEYRTADAFLKDFQLMKTNAIKFNGAGTMIAEEGVQIFQVVKDKLEQERGELTHLEEQVQEQLSNKKPMKRKKKSPKSGGGGGFDVGSSDVWANVNFEDISDDSD